MADIQFEDYSARIEAELNEKIIAWLYEAAGEIQASAIRNTKVDTGQLKGSWTYKVDESSGEARVGSPLENAIWEEFGTGEYAVKGDGRQGYWVYIKGGEVHSKSPKTYTLQKAKQIVAIMRSKGLEAYYTKGKKPKRILQNAFVNNQEKLKRALANMLKKG